MWKWIVGNKMLAAISVVLLLVVIAFAVDGYTSRKEIRRLNAALGVQERVMLAEKEKELKEAETAWLRILNAADAKLVPVLRERDALRKRLAAKPPFVPPATNDETVIRWGNLGYKVRVGPCR